MASTRDTEERRAATNAAPADASDESGARQSVTVSIFGTDYRISADASASYITEVADYVDRSMQLLNERAGQPSTSRLAILAALHIADELFRERAARSDVLTRVQEKTEVLRLLIEGAGEDEPIQSVSAGPSRGSRARDDGRPRALSASRADRE